MSATPFLLSTPLPPVVVSPAAPPAGSPELLLMLLADARLPVAGHTQSAGLEPAVRAGLSALDVPDYLTARLRTVVKVEAATAVVALHGLRHGSATGAGAGLAEVESAWAARTPSQALRRTSRKQARALLRLVRHLWPDAVCFDTSGPPGASRAVVLAAAANACGLSPVSLVRLIGYDDLQTVAAAALKLVPLDPLVATSWVHHALADVEELVGELSGLTRPQDIPVAGAPQIEVWAEAHAVSSRRLFSA